MNSLEGSANNFDARLVIGPVQVGGLLSAALFGCLVCQSYLYFARFTSDHLGLKATVSAVMLIQLGHFVCVISVLWTMTVSTYGDPSQLRVFPLAADLAIPLSSFTVFIVQSFYVFRLWKLARNVSLPILCQTFSVVAQTLTLIAAARAISMTDLTVFEESQNLLIAFSFIVRAVSDWITTAGIAWSFKKKQGSDIIVDQSMMTMIDRLIYWTIETALVTSLMIITVLVLFLVLKQNFVWFGAWLMWPNVVGNSFLASLNRRLLDRRSLLRETWRAPRRDTQSRGGSLYTIVFRAGAMQPQADPLENFENQDVQVFQAAERSIDQDRRQVSKPAVVLLQACV
ncbi:hypothetical protein EDB19DRAFT_1845172 [Suillus lakei]|nr:hypothetical protein EDB19DRAFT_1845172 [Suillus lakei]